MTHFLVCDCTGTYFIFRSQCFSNDRNKLFARINSLRLNSDSFDYFRLTELKTIETVSIERKLQDFFTGHSTRTSSYGCRCVLLFKIRKSSNPEGNSEVIRSASLVFSWGESHCLGFNRLDNGSLEPGE